jgi:hypothetical protein
MKGRFMRDEGRRWSDVALDSIPSQESQLGGRGGGAHPGQRIVKRHPRRLTNHLLQAALMLGRVSLTTHASILESCPNAMMGNNPYPTSMIAIRH